MKTEQIQDTELTYISTNPFQSKSSTHSGYGANDRKSGKRPRIQKPVYSMRFS
jgi:hypothetical protein